MCVSVCVCLCVLSLCLEGNPGRPKYLGKATAAARAALPIPVDVCSVIVCPNNGIWLPVVEDFNVITDVDTCECTHGLYEHDDKGVCTES